MKTINKVLIGSVAVLATAAIVQFGETTKKASAAAIADGKIKVDAQKQTVTIDASVLGAEEGKNRQIYFGFPKVSVDKKNNKRIVVAPAKWDVYDTAASSQGTLTISLASLKNSVDNYIQIKGSEDKTPVTIMIPKAEKYRAEFKPLAAGTNADKFFKVTKATKENGIYPEYDGSKVKIRTQYGNWTDLTLDNNNPFTKYQNQGATLYLKVPASDNTSIATLTGVTYVDKKKDADGHDIPVSVKKASSFASAEIKVTVKKRPEGPKVKVDFVKNEWTIPKGCQYRISSIDYVAGRGFDATYNRAIVENILEYMDEGESAIIEQKKVGNRKELESKVAHLRVTCPEDIWGDFSIDYNNPSVAQTIDDGAISITLSSDFKKLNFENTSDKTYQVGLTRTHYDGDEEDVTVTGWKDIPARKVSGSTIKKGTYSLKLPSSDASLWIRTKGDPKTATLSSDKLYLNEVSYNPARIKIAQEAAKLMEEGAITGTSKPLTISADKKKVVLLRPVANSGVSYKWTTTNANLVKIDGTLANDTSLSEVTFNGVDNTATVTLRAVVTAKGDDDDDDEYEYVYFVITVKKITNGSNTTYEIVKVAKGTDRNPDPSPADIVIAKEVEKLMEEGAVTGTSKALTISADKKKVVLPSPNENSGVSYKWTTTNSKLVKYDGTLANDTALSEVAFNGAGNTATVTLKAMVYARRGRARYVYFVITVKKVTNGSNTTYEIINVAKGTSSNPD